MALESKVWGPYYWFVLHTIALSYPLNPNEVTKKRKHEESPSPKKQKKPRTENKENIDIRPQLKAVRRNLFPRPEVSAQGGGARKRTRKNKNKRNKKTRQRHKKSRKNTTKKNRKAKGKHRTPRH